MILLGLIASLAAAAGPLNLCYFSLNNDKEFVEMKKLTKKLSLDNITVAEYLTRGGRPCKSFKKMIESGVKCDGLILSGHYTGAFGGKRARGSLEMSCLEKLACDSKYRDFFENIRALWLQGCRTLGQKLVSDGRPIGCTTADCHRDRVGAELRQDHLSQSFARLEMEFSATLDQDNPMSSRWLRIAPRATVFGWTLSAPGTRAQSRYSLPYHLAHITRLNDDRKEFFDNPTKTISAASAVKYSAAMLDLLSRPVFLETHRCYNEDVYTDAWLFHGQAKRGESGPLPYSFANPDLQAFPSLASQNDSRLLRARELDCLLKSKLSAGQLDAVVDEVLSDERLLGYNFNALYEAILRIRKKGGFGQLGRLRKKLMDSEVLRHFLMRKLAAKELGTLRRIDYYAFYRDIIGQSIPAVEQGIWRVAREEHLYADIPESDYNRKSYIRTLLQSLVKHGLFNGPKLERVASATPNLATLQAAAQLAKRFPNRGRILTRVISSPKADRETLHLVLAAIGNWKTPIDGANRILRSILAHPQATGKTYWEAEKVIKRSKSALDREQLLSELSLMRQELGIEEYPPRPKIHPWRQKE